MRKYQKYITPKICGICQKEYLPKSWNNTMFPICQNVICRQKRKEQMRKKVSLACIYCGKIIIAKGKLQLALAKKGRAYCDDVCKKAYLKDLSSKTMSKTNQKYASERMKKNNPMFNPVCVEKMKKKMKGRTFLSRGGNGFMTKQQLKLWKALDLKEETLEYPIKTALVKAQFQSLPNYYSPDIGIKEIKLAIEIDGKTHKLKKWKFLDKRKTAVLNALGWTVLRFWNEEVDEDLEKCVEMVMFIILKLKKTTITL